MTDASSPDRADEPAPPGIGPRPSTAAPGAVRAAIRARILGATLGAHATADAPGHVGGRYRLIREIGRGGVGVVWEAEHATLRKRVALKLLRRADGDVGAPAARLLREAIAASSIGHEHIVRVDDYGVDGAGEPFLVMELLAGRSLATWLAEHGSMRWSQAVVILRQLCSALAAAHAAGVIHRDLKPANVFLVDHPDGRVHAKLLDFGMCKRLDGEGSTGATTRAGMALGTPAYMAPEQIAHAEIDGRTDLYALGCILYEMLTGRLAFPGARVADVLHDHVGGVLPPLAALDHEVAALVRRALSVDPGDRPRDAEAMRTAIEAIGRPPNASTSRPTGKRRVIAMVVVAGAATGGAMQLAVRPIEAAAPMSIAMAALALPHPVVPAPVPAPIVTRIEAAPALVPAPAARSRPRSIRRATPASVVPPEPVPPPSRRIDGIRDPFADP